MAGFAGTAAYQTQRDSNTNRQAIILSIASTIFFAQFILALFLKESSFFSPPARSSDAAVRPPVAVLSACRHLRKEKEVSWLPPPPLPVGNLTARLPDLTGHDGQGDDMQQPYMDKGVVGDPLLKGKV